MADGRDATPELRMTLPDHMSGQSQVRVVQLMLELLQLMAEQQGIEVDWQITGWQHVDDEEAAE